MTAVDLFCGCGGLSRGLGKGGFDVRAGIDSWKDAVRVYAANNKSPGHDAIVHDLSDEEGTIELVSKYHPFLIAGGPPCQDFSSAGHRAEGDRADLTVKYARVVTTIRPQAFIMENVPRAQLSAAFSNAVDIFRQAGYGLTISVMNASHCGVPQLRKRLFVIGMLDEEDGFLLEDLVSGQSTAPMTIRKYLGSEIDIEHYYRHPRTYQRRAIFSLDEPSPTIRGINRPVPSTYKIHANDAIKDLTNVRSLTMEERARIQTFPKGYFDIDIPKGSKEQMIGNAVPVELARFVAKRLHAYAIDRMSSQRHRAMRQDDLVDHVDEMISMLNVSRSVRSSMRDDLMATFGNPNDDSDEYLMAAE
ncbi:DNA (cytosine-5-)-methyltransferase [Agrobacterium rubi]|nr:DNA (cytosine-5-)-methyltransferase [Agrobacterium rubi]NTF23869.1 DNA (cytosine-5-)-methyltransferase [Agrobacterium rubi]